MLIPYFIVFSMLSGLYAYYVSPAAGYIGFPDQPNGAKLVASSLALATFVLLTPADGSARGFFLNLLLATYIVPSAVMYALADKPNYIAFSIGLACLIVYFVSAIPLRRIRIAKLSANAIMRIMVILTIFYILIMAYVAGFKNFNLNISRVYDFRDTAAENIPGIFAYLSTIFSKIIIPMGAVIGLMTRRYTVVIVMIISSILLYGFVSHRGVLLYPMVALGIYFVLTRSPQFSRVLIVLMIIFLIGFIDAAMYFMVGAGSIWGWFVDIIVKRGFMVPALLDFNHIEFFWDNPRYYWSASRLTMGMISSPYELPPANLIGKEFFQNPATAANTGFIGNGFAQAGLWGMVAYSICVGLVIAFLNTYGRYLGLPLVAAMLAVQMMTMFTGTDFLTMLLTHGMLASLFVLMVMEAPAARRTASHPKSSP
ncbi:hypothetical protein EET67_04220 [Pseudaminobacter arsenicus]|uniref:Oligosaccharide repeat unit polymerase n=1 Tax=Borborobacter arsenicus TaxID=1851146 RepID=A0A432V9N0_9HYPH|nr:hypothetical protein [Pseudaminobacter arsenicus]RUM98859.1 hypothetical protein EET67_04220 [Pseudaminobacter arsenicus]